MPSESVFGRADISYTLSERHQQNSIQIDNAVQSMVPAWFFHSAELFIGRSAHHTGFVHQFGTLKLRRILIMANIREGILFNRGFS